MRRTSLALALAAGLLAGPAHAAPMLAQASGDWNDNDHWLTWTASVSFETADGADVPFTDAYGGIGHAFVWNAGTPSPVVEGTLFGRQSLRYCLTTCADYPVADYSFRLDSLTAFEIDETPNIIRLFGTDAAGHSFTLGSIMRCGLLACLPAPVVAFDQPYFLDDEQYGDGFFVGQPYYAGFAYTKTVAINGAIPEPGAWAAMILGLFGLGYALRRRKREPLSSPVV